MSELVWTERAVIHNRADEHALTRSIRRQSGPSPKPPAAWCERALASIASLFPSIHPSAHAMDRNPSHGRFRPSKSIAPRVELDEFVDAAPSDPSRAQSVHPIATTSASSGDELADLWGGDDVEDAELEW